MPIPTITQIRRTLLKFPHLKRLTMWALFTAALTYAVRSAGLALKSDESGKIEEAVEQSTGLGAHEKWDGNAAAWWAPGAAGANALVAAPAIVPAPKDEVPDIVNSSPRTSAASRDASLRLVELFPVKTSRLSPISLQGGPLVNTEAFPAQISGGLSGSLGPVFPLEGGTTSGGAAGSAPSLAAAPVPEPSTAALLAMSAFGFGLRRRRQG